MNVKNITEINSSDISAELAANELIDPRWYCGPFVNLKTILAKQKGKRYENITKHIMSKVGDVYDVRETRHYDFHFNGKKIEMKGSMINHKTDNVFSFLQVRPYQNFDNLLLVAFMFDGTIKMFKLEKDEVWSLIHAGIFKPQHGGKGAKFKDTYCYVGTLDPFIKYHWMDAKVA